MSNYVLYKTLPIDLGFGELNSALISYILEMGKLPRAVENLKHGVLKLDRR